MAQDHRDDHHDHHPGQEQHDDVNGDFVLAAVATGVIADLFLSN